MHFWLNYCDENHAERIPIAVENINDLFHLASEVMLSDSTRIDEDEYWSSLEDGTEN